MPAHRPFGLFGRYAESCARMTGAAIRWVRGNGVDSQTARLRVVIVLTDLVLPIGTYGGLVDYSKGRRIDRENVRVIGTVVDVVEDYYYDRGGKQCVVRVLASFRQEETGNVFYLGERTAKAGQRYVSAMPCSVAPRIAVGDTVPIEYAASDPKVNRIYTETSAVGPSLEPLLIAALWLLFGGAIFVERFGKKLWDW